MTLNKSKELLLEMKNIHIDGFSDERWHKILKGVDLTLYRGEILGLIGAVSYTHLTLPTICSV